MWRHRRHVGVPRTKDFSIVRDTTMAAMSLSFYSLRNEWKRSIESEVAFASHRVDRRTLFLGRVLIEENCFIGTCRTADNSLIEEHSHIHGSIARGISNRQSKEIQAKNWVVIGGYPALCSNGITNCLRCSLCITVCMRNYAYWPSR
jgi:hypothetical protein